MTSYKQSQSAYTFRNWLLHNAIQMSLFPKIDWSDIIDVHCDHEVPNTGYPTNTHTNLTVTYM